MTQSAAPLQADPSSPVHSDWPRLGLKPLALLGLFALLLLLLAVSLAVGSVSIPLRQIVIILTGGAAEKVSWQHIVMLFRLPKALTAALAGASLAVAGLQMQTMFRNPLAGPFVLGISSGASLGVALVVLSTGVTASGAMLLSGLGIIADFSVVIAASLGAAVVAGLVMLASRRVQTMTLLILGIMFGYATSALVNILLHFSISERIHAYINWTFGSFGGTTWEEMKVFVPALLVGLLIAQLLVKPLNALLLGENYARSMGLTVKRAQFWILLSTSILAGVVTAFCGPIGFLGIAIPHLGRSLFNTSDHRILVPAVTLLGAIAALIADLVAQVPGSDIILPLNAITALIGAPVVVWVILNQRNLKETFAS